MEIEIGKGDIEIVIVTQEGRTGVLLRRQGEEHPVGEFTNTGGQIYEHKDDDVLIWLSRLDSARILQDTVNQAVLKLQGIPRET